jgi:hypothetical protein
MPIRTKCVLLVSVLDVKLTLPVPFPVYVPACVSVSRCVWPACVGVGRSVCPARHRPATEQLPREDGAGDRVDVLRLQTVCLSSRRSVPQRGDGHLPHDGIACGSILATTRKRRARSCQECTRGTRALLWLSVLASIRPQRGGGERAPRRGCRNQTRFILCHQSVGHPPVLAPSHLQVWENTPGVNDLPFLDALWTAMDEAISLKDAEVYSYKSDGEKDDPFGAQADVFFRV